MSAALRQAVEDLIDYCQSLGSIDEIAAELKHLGDNVDYVMTRDAVAPHPDTELVLSMHAMALGTLGQRLVEVLGQGILGINCHDDVTACSLIGRVVKTKKAGGS